MSARVRMDLTRCLQLLLELDELKSDTTITRGILEAIKNLIFLDGDNKIKLQKLIKYVR